MTWEPLEQVVAIVIHLGWENSLKIKKIPKMSI